MHKASERGEKFLRMSKHDFDGRLKWKHRFAHMFKYIEFVIAIAIAITIMHFAFIYYTEQTMAFSRRFLITVLFWIVFTEPLKVILVIKRFSYSTLLVELMEMTIFCLNANKSASS